MSESEPVNPEFETLLEHLRQTRGFDFTGYKRASLMRRVLKRLENVGINGYPAYIDYLEVHPEEFRFLLDTILINVTSFFRDPPAWDVLGGEIIPRLLGSKRPEEPIRVWSAGCASGEEAYTLAMILAEAVGPVAFRDRVKIYATDVDEEALTKARSAQYETKEIQSIPPKLLEKYFEPDTNDRLLFNKDLRRCVIFGRHDLIQDAPISRIDLLTCRNTLMYFNTETQTRILERFHYALNDRGFLFLGKAETLMTYNNTYQPIDLKQRIFVKLAKGNLLRDRLSRLTGSGPEQAADLVNHLKLREVAFESNSVAQLIVDYQGLLAQVNHRARVLFGIDPVNVGRPFQDVQVSYRPADVRSCIDRAYNERQSVTLNEIEWTTLSGDLSYLNIQVIPLFDAGGVLLGASVTFIDATVNRRLQEELQTSHRALEVAYEELQSTNEELETMNEELQSTIEELETTNEELQSTNEELETMNEELQATNEEIETVNGELRSRSDDLNKVNLFLRLILGSLSSGVVVVDQDFQIQIWNDKAADLWGLRSDEVRDKNLMDLDIGLPLEEIKQLLQICVSGETESKELTLDAVNRRGKAIRCRVTCSSIVMGDNKARGAILVMEINADGATS